MANPRLVQEPLGITAGAMTQPFSTTASNKGLGGLNLDIDNWARQYRPRAVCRDVPLPTTPSTSSLLGRLTNDDLKDISGLRVIRPSQEAAGRDRGTCRCRPSIAAACIRLNRRRTMLGERRQVTVMFSDLVGSTALSARMDPRTCVRSFRPIRHALSRRCATLAGSWPSTWATACLSISVIRRPMRTTPSALYGGAGTDRGGGWAQVERFAANSCRNCNWARGCRDLIGSGSAQEQAIVGETPNPRGAFAGDRRTGHGRHRRRHAKASRQSLRVAGPRGQGH